MFIEQLAGLTEKATRDNLGWNPHPCPSAYEQLHQQDPVGHPQCHDRYVIYGSQNLCLMHYLTSQVSLCRTP